MKKIKMSLIVKISGIVFVAFALVLGNEIRLGIARYSKNTIETDALATTKNIDKFFKDYTDLTIYKSYSLDSSEFQNIYQNMFSGDASLIKSLVTTDGQIIDISRETLEDEIICLTVSQSQETRIKEKTPIYIDLGSMEDKNVEKFENVFNESEEITGDITLSVAFDKNTDFSDNEFRNIDIAKIVVDGETIINRQISKETVEISGKISFYSSQNQEIFLADNKQSSSYDKSASQINQTIIVDYKNAMQGIEDQLNQHFKQYVKFDHLFSSTNYADYYLLDTYKYNDKYYSSILVKIVDWTKINHMFSDAKYNDLTDEEIIQSGTQGYIIVTKEYSRLIMDSMERFIIDNYSTYFLVLILIAIICFILAYMIIKPIHRLERAAKHIARKDFNYPVDITRHDELGDLARSIDKMSKDLEKTIDHLYQQVEKIKSLELIRKDFVSNFTHEIKTPLGIINGFSELIELEQDDEKRNEYIHIIQNETKKINELVRAMLEYSRLESENVMLDIEDVDLLEIVDETIESMMYLVKKKNIQLETSLKSISIQADRFKMQMVMNNLISNALRYTNEGKTIRISLDQNTFSVENEGAHIPEDELEKIWLTFYKVNKSRNEEGTGLGLSICKVIFDLHHFDYGVKNTDTGVLFYFHFEGSENEC